MKKQFDIKYRPQIESGEYKVETRSEMPVRIICWDCRNRIDMTPRHIIALIDAGPDEEICVQMADDGRFYNDKKEDGFDLFIVTPEPELTEFEKAIEGYIKSYTSIVQTETAAKQWAEELLDLARKELISEMLTSDPKETALYKAGVLDGKAEALKDLPRWRTWELGACGNGTGRPIALVYSGRYRLVDCLGIGGEKYILLSDLEKLPGYKEDEK